MAPKYGKTTPKGKGVKKDSTTKQKQTPEKKKQELLEAEAGALRIVEERLPHVMSPRLYRKIGDPGKSFWDELVELKGQKGKVGRITDRELQAMEAKYPANADEAVAKFPVDKSLEIDPDLHDSLALSILTDMTKRNRKGLYGILNLMPSLNSREFGGVINSLVGLNCTAGTSNANHVLEVLKIIVAKGWDTTHTGAFNHGKPVFIESLMNSFGRAGTCYCKQRSWYFDNKHLLKPFAPMTECDKLFQPEKAEDPCLCSEEELSKISESNYLGALLVGDRLNNVALASFLKSIDELVKPIGTQHNLTSQYIQTVKVDLLAKAKDFNAKLAGSTMSWKCSVQYRNELVVSRTCTDPWTHVDYKLAFAIMSATVGQKNGAVQLEPERWLWDASGVTQCGLDVAFMKDLNAGVNKFNRMIKDASVSQAVHILSLCGAKEKDLLGASRTWSMHYAILETLAGKKGGDLLLARAMGLFPDGSAKNYKTITKVKEDWTALTKTQAWQYVSPTHTGPISAAMQLLTKLEAGEIDGDAFKSYVGIEAQVAEKFQWFVQQTIFSPGSVETKTEYGTKAVLIKLEKVQTLEGVALATMLEELIQFRFMLNAEQWAEVKKQGDKALGTSGGASKKAKMETDIQSSVLDEGMQAAKDFF